EAATGHPYHTDANLESRLGDIGLYADLSLRFLRWLALRGGLRGDVFTYDVNNLCAVQSVEHPSSTHPPGDASCSSQQNFGAYRARNRVGCARSARLSVPFYGQNANLTYVNAMFHDARLLIPYVPDLVLRGHGAVFGDLPWSKEKLNHHALRAAFAAGLTYVGP